ncbi:hypothetical protein ASPWEDRAFT_170538 [Aspergillus wentii DTO 134E9]|uniref:Uncharacterized protein n=1 Tax=Aspergillus wentii DTO 134E9 TaxID=1073089 RepID=A0A1L9RQ76_ASPWE|nr:uncharacterized protein ASPWEDRAFT_170538 [Aspergillus wentii DTO 134E9]KAI9928466.1 hypothetical protein MW887_002511 [Aspergillus wentii]OJJ37042.1 hypothetical protein ASPWEDRAFT_170538 [Aspergillus wentii DTO 134E9]
MATTHTAPTVTRRGPEHGKEAAQVLSGAFSKSAFTSWLMRTPQSTWTDEIPADVLDNWFNKSVPERVGHGAELVEAGNWAAVAIWFPPGVNMPSNGPISPQLKEFREIFGAEKKRHLQGEKYWYLNIIGRHPERTEKGVIRALIDPYLKRAQQEGVPVWLEAITDHGRKVYEHLGFRTVVERRIGVGKANTKGEYEENGEGLMVYGMMVDAPASLWKRVYNYLVSWL